MEYKYVDGHVEVWKDGRFLFSADTLDEAKREVRLGAYEEEYTCGQQPMAV